MQGSNRLSSHMQNGKLLFLLSIFIAVYWFVGNKINVYQTKLTGAIFEMLWLPMLFLLFVIPCLATYFWKKENYVLKSTNLLTMITSVIFILAIIFIK
jgi:hypothetical protein